MRNQVLRPSAHINYLFSYSSGLHFRVVTTRPRIISNYLVGQCPSRRTLTSSSGEGVVPHQFQAIYKFLA